MLGLKIFNGNQYNGSTNFAKVVAVINRGLDVIDSGVGSAAEHMDVDRECLRLGSARPRLRFFTWDRFSVTVGLFCDEGKLLDRGRCCDIPVVRRPTGGGVLFHGEDLAFSLFLPGRDMLLDRRGLASAIVAGIAPGCRDSDSSVFSTGPCRFCLSTVAVPDLVVRGMKIGGCAERKARTGVLFQFSLFLAEPDWEQIALLVRDPGDVDEMRQKAATVESLLGSRMVRERVQQAIQQQIGEWVWSGVQM